MAQVKFSALVSDIKGRLGGSIFQGGKGATILKNASYKGVNRSILSETTRSNFVFISNLWFNLDYTVKNQWNAAAELVFITNKFGDPIQITGRQLFIRRNSNLQTCSLSLITTPGPLLDPVPFYPLEMTVDALGEIMITVSTIDPLWYIVLSSKRQYKGGGLGSPGGFKQWFCVQIVVAGTFSIQAFYAAKWGPTVASTSFLYKFKLVNASTGYATPWSYGSANVV